MATSATNCGSAFIPSIALESRLSPPSNSSRSAAETATPGGGTGRSCAYKVVRRRKQLERMRMGLDGIDRQLVDYFFDAFHLSGYAFCFVLGPVGSHLSVQGDHAVFDVHFNRAALDVGIVGQFQPHLVVDQVIRLRARLLGKGPYRATDQKTECHQQRQISRHFSFPFIPATERQSSSFRKSARSRQFSRTFTYNSRNTFLLNNASISRRASVPTVFSREPFFPI